GPDAYATVRAYKGIVVADPETSLLLTKGRHEGPDLVDPLRGKVTAWLQAEAAGVPSTGPMHTAPVAVAPGANTFDLTMLGVAGAKLTFTATVTGTILTLGMVSVSAPAASGVHAVAPLFTVVAKGGATSDDDSFSNVDSEVAAGQSVVLGPGLLVLADWSA